MIYCIKPVLYGRKSNKNLFNNCYKFSGGITEISQT